MTQSRLGLALTLALVAGCMKTTVKMGAPAGTTTEHTAKFFLGGLVGEENFNLSELCPQGVSKIEESEQFKDIALSCVTCSIYSPRTVRITCASGSAYLVVPDEASGRSLVQAVADTNTTQTR